MFWGEGLFVFLKFMEVMVVLFWYIVDKDSGLIVLMWFRFCDLLLNNGIEVFGYWLVNVKNVYGKFCVEWVCLMYDRKEVVFIIKFLFLIVVYILFG